MARRDAGFVFTNLMHLIDEVFLWEAHRRIRKDGASGVDGETAQSYAEELGANLRKLHRRMKSGRYRAPPVKRGWIPKEDGTHRPIGIPAFEDKIVQKAVSMLLEAIYEEDFEEVSYGFRRGRSAHDALVGLRQSCYDVSVSHVIDADIQGYFDAIDHKQLMQFLKNRINDGTLLRFIGKWLKAGVLAGEQIIHPESGTPQGGIISPILSNLYLHEVLDRWIAEWVKPVMKGKVFLIRYADDFVLGFQREDDASRVMKVLPKRFAKYGLTIHPDKTRCLKFQKPVGRDNEGDSFDFLGFTHYWGKSRRGNWTIKRRTCKGRQRRAMSGIWQWCKEHLHQPVSWQWQTLRSKLRGHYHYYGIIGNYKQLEVYYEHAIGSWRFWLNRRNSKHGRSVARSKATILKAHPLPSPRIMKSV
jgi:group II intron reverse transcriptase/maturase